MKFFKEALWVYVAAATILIFCVMISLLVWNGLVPTDGFAWFGPLMGSFVLAISRCGLVDWQFDKYIERGDVYIKGSKVKLYMMAGVVVAVMDVILYVLMFLVYYWKIFTGKLLCLALSAMYVSSLFLVNAVLFKFSRMEKIRH